MKKTLTPQEYHDKLEEKHTRGFEIPGVVGAIIGLLIGLAVAFFLKRGDMEYDAAENVTSNGVITYIIFGVIGLVAGGLLLPPLSRVLGNLSDATGSRRIDRKTRAYEKEYQAGIREMGPTFSKSELVQRASEQMADFFFDKGIRTIDRTTEYKNLECHFSISVEDSSITYYIDRGWKLSYEAKLRDPQSIIGALGSIRFTAEGWRFEQITDPQKRGAIALSLAQTVSSLVMDMAAELPDDRNPRCDIKHNGNTHYELIYYAENRRYEPPRRI